MSKLEDQQQRTRTVRLPAQFDRSKIGQVQDELHDSYVSVTLDPDGHVLTVTYNFPATSFNIQIMIMA